VAESKNKWTFGRSATEALYSIADTTIWKLRPLKLNRNPYLKTDLEYFEKRRAGKIAAKFRAAVYKKFNNTCPGCGQSLFNGEQVDLHHVLPVAKGGKYSLTNIQPLHQICHQKVTYGVRKAAG
jgi:RNA-directed DNA polymerase